tara:strand:- start:814 stop:1353 length:540 start_codon:yes stop_codon:yes gene_type:complete
MSELRTNRIIPRDGLPSGSAGGVIQVRQKVITDRYTETVPPSNNGPYGNLVNSEVITPTRSDSKIWIIMNLNIGAGNDGNVSVTLFRNGSIISGSVGASVGSRTPVTATDFTSSTSRQTQINLNYIDSPASTSAQTYGFKFSHAENGDMNCYLNRDNNFGTSYHNQVPISTITLMELSG